MKLLATDLVVRYNRGEGKISLLVPQSSEELDEWKRFYELGDVSKAKKAKLAKELGIALVAFFEATHKLDFVTADAPTARRDSMGKKGGPFKFSDARLLIDRINDHSSKDDVEAIATVLRKASSAGDSEARKYLKNTWPKLRDILMRRVSRRRT